LRRTGPVDSSGMQPSSRRDGFVARVGVGVLVDLVLASRWVARVNRLSVQEREPTSVSISPDEQWPPKILPPALLGRLVTIPYHPRRVDMLGKIVKLQLNRIKKRVEARYKIPFEYGDDVVKLVVSRCTESESGGRMIDAILTNTMLPHISREFLTRMMEGRAGRSSGCRWVSRARISTTRLTLRLDGDS
jgi:hypothetical protein